VPVQRRAIPAFGDALAATLHVPIGISAIGIGGTSVREWLPSGSRVGPQPTTGAHMRALEPGAWACTGDRRRPPTLNAIRHLGGGVGDDRLKDRRGRLIAHDPTSLTLLPTGIIRCTTAAPARRADHPVLNRHGQIHPPGRLSHLETADCLLGS
jgi:hypothetical protein